MMDGKETIMTLSRFAVAIVASCAAVVISVTPGLAGQMPQGAGHAAMAQAKPDAGMAAKCQAMMADREKMMTEMKAADQRLDDLVSKMNGAPNMAKADAIAAVVNEMITQRRAMQGVMMKMQHGMMAHMMEHMQAGKDSMAMCSMMKPMGGMKH
jgi:hypothetical protein